MNLYEILQNPDRVGEGMTHFERLFAQKVGGGKINEIFGIPPLNYIGNGSNLLDYRISGNTVQDGTPTPENPVPVVGCGTDTEDGFKLPLTVNGTEYPIYLGTVPTTRRVKKLVLTGEDYYWSATYWANAFVFYSAISTALPQPITGIGICSHFRLHATPVLSSGEFYIQFAPEINRIVIGFGKSGFATIDDFKSYLAQQYAAGTPVTVWYVLAEPETAIVNEPLMKIGDYADTISFAQAGVTIPTVNGENVLDVPTTVPPSEVWIRGKIKEV